jgi:hypothetical protein
VIHPINHAEDVTPAFSTRDHTCIDVDNEPRSKVLVSVAFDKSWRFVEKDPFLAHNPRAILRDRLRTHLEVAMRNGEQDLLSLANGAISRLRSELGTFSNS